MKNIYWDYFHEKGSPAKEVNKNSFPQEFFAIVGLFAEDCNYNLVECYGQMGNLYITGYTDKAKNELMLRYGSDELVVARVAFVNTKCGRMTELYRLLNLLQESKHYKGIRIECVRTEAMKNWCIKNGMSPCGDDYK